MSIPVYFAITAALAAAGLLAGRWWLVPVVIGLWASGLGIAALAGAFHQTSEDTSGALFIFAAWPTMFWVLAFIIATAARRIGRWIATHTRHRPPVQQTPATD